MSGVRAFLHDDDVFPEYFARDFPHKYKLVSANGVPVSVRRTLLSSFEGKVKASRAGSNSSISRTDRAVDRLRRKLAVRAVKNEKIKLSIP